MAKYTKRKDGRYFTTITIGHDNITNKPIKKGIYGYTVKELDAKKADILQHLNHGTYSDDKGMTVAQWSWKWFGIYKSHNATTTKESYYHTIRTHIIPTLGSIQLKNLRKSDIQQLLLSRSDKPETQKKIKLTLNQILETAIDDGLLYKNVARNIKLSIPKTKQKRRPLTDVEIKAIQTAHLTDKERALLLILRWTGARRGEALALSKTCINRKKNIVKIEHSLTFTQKGSELKEPKTFSSIREVDVPSEIIDELHQYIKSIDTFYLFTAPKGGFYTKASFRRFWGQIIDKLNTAIGGDKNHRIIYNLTPHIFRHNYATMLYYAGIDTIDAKRLLGHSDIKTTLDIYTHLNKEKSQTAEKIETLYLTNAK
ncbi:tyrosine-type recombinase/integrase [Anaerostipes sp.]|uniref:tyrosine-type recombinase/integrase n=1 Tax=Anaerostipes sp. TaxID=1872530 RepID=UPI0025C51440|nr:site-specific integrase [Anaerostipes sp.]MBS7007034.1 site-specific integrase [Anaerostipes sp.]